jgi:hypothetical protein
MPCTWSRGQFVKNVPAVVEGSAFDRIGDPGGSLPLAPGAALWVVGVVGVAGPPVRKLPAI